MSYFFAIKGYKGTISYAPMISGKKRSEAGGYDGR